MVICALFFFLFKMAICCIYLFLKGNLTLARKFTVLETQLELAYPKFIPSVLVLKVRVVLGLILNTPFSSSHVFSDKLFLSNPRKTICNVVIKETKPI